MDSMTEIFESLGSNKGEKKSENKDDLCNYRRNSEFKSRGMSRSGRKSKRNSEFKSGYKGELNTAIEKSKAKKEMENEKLEGMGSIGRVSPRFSDVLES